MFKWLDRIFDELDRRKREAWSRDYERGEAAAQAEIDRGATPDEIDYFYSISHDAPDQTGFDVGYRAVLRPHLPREDMESPTPVANIDTETRLLTIDECIDRLRRRAMDSRDPLDPISVSARVLRAILDLPQFEGQS